MKIRTVSDISECALLWRRVAGGGTLFHQWDLRLCFHLEFMNRPHFVVAEEGDRVVGLLPLSYVEEVGAFAFFPGELWQGKTWLERNRILAADELVLRAMFDELDAPGMLRYLEADSIPAGFGRAVEDEIGYLFRPPAVDCNYDQYRDTIPGKTLRRFQKEIARLTDQGVEFRYNQPDAIPIMLEMNLKAFGDYSYFRDSRFVRSFERLVSFLETNDALLVTTVIIGGRIAAIDLGAVWNNAYTVLAGGVDREFAGVAKLINFHHLELACNRRFDELDFLCGDFGWKGRFRLLPRPLVEIRGKPCEGGFCFETTAVDHG